MTEGGARAERSYAAEKLDTALQGWHHESREAALVLADQHGIPHELTVSRATWFEVAPWKAVSVLACPASHRWPVAHVDVIEAVTDYRTAEGLDVLTAFHGGVSFHRTRGEMSVSCASVPAVLCAMNLVHDLVEERTTPHKARLDFARRFPNAGTDLQDPYLHRLLFGRQVRTPDPDEPYVSAFPTRAIASKPSPTHGRGQGDDRLP